MQHTYLIFTCLKYLVKIFNKILQFNESNLKHYTVLKSINYMISRILICISKFHEDVALLKM